MCIRDSDSSIHAERKVNGSRVNADVEYRTEMAFRCPTAKVVGKSELKDYELLFRGGRRGAVATVEPKEGSTVPVLILSLIHI